ncbi:MAG TPA: septum formation initiator family protein, partial [Bacteroidia bacterium]|nr:septum formation initiator family protein [Bacteroidia bacterium]
MKNFKIPSVLKNKYVIAVLVFLVWLTFFDQNSFLVQYSYQQDLNKLEKEHEYYKTQIDYNKAQLTQLETDTALLEKYAREKYYMKKKNEDIFVLVADSDST